MVVCSALRKSGAPGCGRALRWGKQGSTLWLRQHKAPACPSTLPQCPATPTTVTGDSWESPLEGDRELVVSVVHKNALQISYMTKFINIFFEWEDRIAIKKSFIKVFFSPKLITTLVVEGLSSKYIIPFQLLFTGSLLKWIWDNFMLKRKMYSLAKYAIGNSKRVWTVSG